MNRREFMHAAIAAAAAGAVGQSIAATPARPNILFILADDVGHGDLSCTATPIT